MSIMIGTMADKSLGSESVEEAHKGVFLDAMPLEYGNSEGQVPLRQPVDEIFVGDSLLAVVTDGVLHQTSLISHRGLNWILV